MLCSRLERLERLSDRRHIAEPKLDGQAGLGVLTALGNERENRYSHRP